MVGVGIIGCGYIAKKHVASIANCKELTLAAVSDLQVDRMEEVAKSYRQKQSNEVVPITIYEDYHNLLQDSRVEVVIVSTISSLHAQIAIQALQHKKHVIIEKPIALSLQEVEEMIRLAEQKDRRIFVCHQLRYRPFMRKLKSFIEKGYFGDIYLGVATLRLHRSQAYYASSPWKGTWDKDGGMLLNQGIHMVDLLLWLLGDATSVYGEMMNTNKNKETEDIATGILSFEGQSKGLIEANTITKPSNQGYYLSLFGEEGSIIVGGEHFNEIIHCYSQTHPEAIQALGNTTNDRNEHMYMYQDFIRAIKKQEDHLMTASEGKKALEVIFGMYQSAKEGKPVRFPLNDFRTEWMHDW
ncbi:Gfo/Idh/MocA family protein [Virgibacillus salexigens]|uniref:Inositol 2-dehydrogenase n=1 Tax=Virgibacillus massiliensis TaxID=1462526 RepID=A0A024QD41_9BACI|nr:Gfo/Idh/MocA family oxidoreductase [Virgibacillus massiliensis]CDQ40414.1 Inositol 2-dehydrogenase [Virgibacillus massiliensis]